MDCHEALVGSHPGGYGHAARRRALAYTRSAPDDTVAFVAAMGLDAASNVLKEFILRGRERARQTPHRLRAGYRYSLLTLGRTAALRVTSGRNSQRPVNPVVGSSRSRCFPQNKCVVRSVGGAAPRAWMPIHPYFSSGTPISSAPERSYTRDPTKKLGDRFAPERFFGTTLFLFFGRVIAG
jgi:hypothetical protein